MKDGLSYLAPIQTGWRTFPQKSGLTSGIIIGGFGLGGLIFSNVATAIVNPDNLSCYENEEGLLIFADSVTLKVPNMLRILIICYAAIVVLALLLIIEPQKNVTS